MSLRTRVLVFFAAGALAGATPSCEGDACVGQEDAALLQNGLQKQQKVERSGLACENGGHMHPEAEVCVCNAGWGGPTCSMASELVKGAEETGGKTSGAMTCGLGFTVYPYDQPDLWGSAYDGWEGCDGDEQSPIRLNRFAASSTIFGSELQASYGSVSPCYVKNTGNALKLDGMWGSVTLGNNTFDAVQFHFHTGSETFLNGRQLPMEMHIVHVGSAGFAVVGILFQVGLRDLDCFSEVLGDPAPKAGCKKEVTPFNLGDCFAEQLAGSWWSFMGSLTTPPCTEGIRFNIMQKTAKISFNQLRVFRTVLRNNARPPQPINRREVIFNSVYGSA